MNNGININRNGLTAAVLVLTGLLRWGGIPKNRNFDYKITKKDLRHNLARLCDRFRKRKKPYHFDGEPIDNYKDFKVWLGLVKEELEL